MDERQFEKAVARMVQGDKTGLKEIYEKLLQSGHSKAQLKLYEGGRHEILNEVNKDEVYSDILAFVENNVLGE